jgi:hypothetical protein
VDEYDFIRHIFNPEKGALVFAPVAVCTWTGRLCACLGQRRAGEIPLEWSSSRPQDFLVDAEGNVQALVDYGYSEIIVKIVGTNYEARTVVNVNLGGSGGGGGSFTAAVLLKIPHPC